MKSLAVADKYGWPRHVSHQAYYSLLAREYEWELMPLALDQKVGTVIWSPLAGGNLTGKVRRDQPIPESSRVATLGTPGDVPDRERLYRIVDAIDEIVHDTGKTFTQVALNWLLQRPTVVSVIFGARNEAQLRDNLGAAGWNLTPEQVAKLDAASAVPRLYPYWHQVGAFKERNPPPTA
jgi:aryl-alcohol dehydrogenase-like predicted oxidoreductase